MGEGLLRWAKVSDRAHSASVGRPSAIKGI